MTEHEVCMICFESGELTEREAQERNFTDKHDGLLVQVKGLQKLVAERRDRIMQLEEQLENLKRNPVASAAEQKSFKNGWKACADAMQDLSRKAALSLREIDKEAFQLWLDGERK